MGCTDTRPSNSIPDADRLPQKILDVTGLKFLNEYEIDNRINPFYLYSDCFNGKQDIYLVFIKEKKSGTPYLILIDNGKAVLKNIKDFTGATSPLAYAKETNHFPSGSGLPENAKGFVLIFESEITRWVYHDKMEWRCVNPS